MSTHAAIMARFATAAVRVASETPVDPDDLSRGGIRIRVGLNSGPCMASVVGRRNPKFVPLTKLFPRFILDSRSSRLLITCLFFTCRNYCFVHILILIYCMKYWCSQFK